MIARSTLLVSLIIGLIAFGVSFRSTPRDIALAQDDTVDLIATVQALQTKVANQEHRISALEVQAQFIALVYAGRLSDLGSTPTPTPAPLTRIIGGVIVIVPGPGETVEDSANYTNEGIGDPCTGAGLLIDVAPTTKVIVYDADGNRVSLGDIRDGYLLLGGCTMMFSVAVPDMETYTIAIGHRKGPTFTRAELEAKKWALVLTVGGS